MDHVGSSSPVEEDDANIEKTGESEPPREEDGQREREDRAKQEEDERRERESHLTEIELQELREQAVEMKTRGNLAFGEGRIDEALQLYSHALDTCPLVFSADRATYFSNRAAAYIRQTQYKEAIADCTSALTLGASNNKPLQRRAWCYEQGDEGDLDKALLDYKSLIEMEPKNAQARDAIPRISKLIDERNERMKAEMMGKLKDLGNWVLRPFGLSTDSFQLDPQPGGGYSVSMKK